MNKRVYKEIDKLGDIMDTIYKNETISPGLFHEGIFRIHMIQDATEDLIQEL